MPIPSRRLVISKDGAVTTEPIAKHFEKSSILTKQGAKIKVLKFLTKRADLRKKRLTQKRRDIKLHRGFKHKKPHGGGHTFRFRRLESLVKNKHSEMRHHALLTNRRKNKRHSLKLETQLRGKDVSVLLIVRIHRKKNVPPKVLDSLRGLRLLRAWDASLVRNTPSLRRVLRDVLPFVTLGVPTRATIRELVLKRGRLVDASKAKTKAQGGKAKSNGKGKQGKGQRTRKGKGSSDEFVPRVTIKSNVVCEEALGEWGVLCVEDIVDVLASRFDENESEGEDEKVELSDGRLIGRAERFDEVTARINPFSLNRITVPMKGLQSPFNKRGYWGYRGSFINTFVEKII